MDAVEPSAYHVFRVDGMNGTGFFGLAPVDFPWAYFFSEVEAHQAIQEHGKWGENYVILPAYACTRKDW